MFVVILSFHHCDGVVRSQRQSATVILEQGVHTLVWMTAFRKQLLEVQMDKGVSSFLPLCAALRNAWRLFSLLVRVYWNAARLE